jgi:hypothetical protein
MELAPLKSRIFSFYSDGLFFIVSFAAFFLIMGCESSAQAIDNSKDEPPTAQVPESAAPAPSDAKAPTSAKPSGVKKKKKATPVPAKPKFLAGEDPEFAKRYGWPVKYPPPLPGSILPDKRIVAYYGNPLSKRMGVLGQYPKDEMLKRLAKEVESWEKADPAHKVQPALHLISVVAQSDPGPAKKYRRIMPDNIIQEVYGWAKEAHAILFIDIQTGLDDLPALLPRFEWILKNPDVHLAIDPEFHLIKSGKVPGSKVGTCDAADINFASDYLKNIIGKYKLPPKILLVHRFTRGMVTNANQIALSPEINVVINMDGWGAPFLKRDSYRDFIVREPVQFTGLKLFYRNDTKRGHPLLKPQEILRLIPAPIYIQYQ